MTDSKDLSQKINTMWIDRLIPEGHIYQEVDSFYVFAPRANFGAIAPWAMRLIADHIDTLNAPLKQELEELESQ